MSQDTRLKVVELPTRTPSDAMEVMRILNDLKEANEKGQLKCMAVVYFNPSGGWRLDMSASMLVSQLAFATAAMQAEIIQMIGKGPLVEQPKPPAA